MQLSCCKMPNKKNKVFKHTTNQPPPSDSHLKKSNRSLKRKQWRTDEQMLAAINSVQTDHISAVTKAADLHGVPRSTLKDRLSGRVSYMELKVALCLTLV